MHVVNNNVALSQVKPPVDKRAATSFQGVQFNQSLNQDTLQLSASKLQTSNDNVNFTGVKEFLSSKPGKLGLLGTGLLLLLTGCTATFETVRTHRHRPVYGPPPIFVPSHGHSDRVMVYVDNQGNWGFRAVQGTSHVPPGMIEYERIFSNGRAVGWRSITRIHNGHGHVNMQYGPVIRHQYPCGPNVPPWMRDHMHGMRHGQTIVVPPSFPPPHHRRGW